VSVTSTANEDTPKAATAARIYDYFLGGTHNFPADREAAQMVLRVAPVAADIARANRAFLRRVVRFLVDSGIRQFLDLGSGIPTAGNVHEVAQILPDARVVYVDIDPVAVAESLEILDGNDRATAVRGDLRDPDAILNHPDVQRLIDFNEPVGVLIVSVLHFVPDDIEAHGAVDRLMAATPSGSYLAASHGTLVERVDPDDVEAVENVYKGRTSTPVQTRDRAGVERFFAGLEMVEPGLVWLPLWRPDPGEPDAFADNPSDCLVLGGIGRRP
jgi:S-adenosyl methyltransferase